MLMVQNYIAPQPTTTFTSLLLHGDGPNGSTVFTDSSSFNRVVSGQMSASISTAQSVFGGSSIKTLYNSPLVCGASPDFNIASGDFTIDLRVFLISHTATYGAMVISRGALSGWYIHIRQDGVTWVGQNNTYGVNVPGTLATGRWYHIAVERSGSTVTLYIDGISRGTTTQSVTDVNVPMIIGGWDYNSNYPLNGYIDELRFSKGIARWAQDFALPSSAYVSD